MKNKDAIRSSIDLGTNTCLLLIARDGEALEDYATVVRLGQEVDVARIFAPEAMARTLKCLQSYSEKVRARGLDPAETVAVATSQARDARNSADFFFDVEKETGFRFRVISGDDEARLTFLGALLPGMKAEDSAVIDIGGGSTELISSQGGQSVDVGSVRFTERFFRRFQDHPESAVTDDEFWRCQAAVDAALEPLKPWRKNLPAATGLVGVAGTVTTLAAWHLGLEKFDVSKVDRAMLTRGDIHRLVEELKWRNLEERKALPGMEALRADVLLAGALILWRAMEVLDFGGCQVSTRGLRYGVLL
jgi:exopolyphosphatase/guanosine-5'-triphosphate,3'-diphosphate pyrophosphatase